MKCVLVLALLGLALAQWPNHYNRDRIHGYTFDYHSYADLLVVTNSSTCILVGVKDQDNEMQHLQTRYEIEDKVYQQILSGKGEHRSNIDDIRREYHDIRAVFECFRKKVYEMDYDATA